MVKNLPVSKTGPLCALLLGAVVAAAPAGAGTACAATAWVDNGESAVRLLAAETGVGRAEAVTLGLQIRLEPGWMTYWRSPGDAGMPPRLDWSGSSNVAAATVLWPAPERHSAFGMDSFVYRREVVLPIRVRLKRPGAPVSVRLHLDYSVCETICIPMAADLVLELPAGPAGASPEAPLIRAYLAQVPERDGDGLRLRSARLVPAPADAADLVELTLRAARPLVAPDAIVEAEGFGFGRPKVALDDGGRLARLRLPVTAAGGAPTLAGRELVVTVIDGGRAWERRVTVER